MAIRKTDESLGRKPLRLRPGVILALVLVFLQYVLPLVAGDVMIGEFSLGLAGMVGGLVCTLIILVWWLFFSRASWVERVGALVVMIAAVFATKLVVHPSIAGGAQGYLLYVVVRTNPGACLGGSRGRRWPRVGQCAPAGDGSHPRIREPVCGPSCAPRVSSAMR